MSGTRIHFDRIFHPSDFSDASNLAFAHALRIALESGSLLTILHTGSGESAGEGELWIDFPRVRETLERWRLLPVGSPREALFDLGLDVEKVALPHSDPARSIVHYLEKHPHDLIVLATHRDDGLKRWTRPKVALPVIRESAEMTLFIPHGVSGFISVDDGASTLRNILVPIDRLPDPQIAIDAATVFAAALGGQDTTATLLHVGDEREWPAVPLSEGLQWRKSLRAGSVDQQILGAAAEYNADLIVMATQGHHGFLDAFRGSTTERIVRNAACPVLAVPVYRAAEPANATVEGLATGSLAVSL